MGRGSSGATAASARDGKAAAGAGGQRLAGAAPDDAVEQRLVAAVRRGDDRAFEALYHRYHRRIHAYVLGMVADHGRTEDVTQEVFVSALRRMRATEQPLAFKPWLYQIARNACIDAFRRSKRTEEVSFDTEGALAAADRSRLAGVGVAPEAAVASKLELEQLCGAFGGLSETHHEILVLRELEGLSYAEIGRRMGMSRSSVESTLFRARRRLSEEYDDIVSGARCERVQGIIALAVESRLGARDLRRLARHLSHCQPCRREAVAAGLSRDQFTRPSLGRRIAALLPFGGFERFRRAGEAATGAAPPPSGRGAGLVPHLPLLSDHLFGGWGKAAAGAALVIAGAGAGLGVHQAAAPQPPTASARAERPAPLPATGSSTGSGWGSGSGSNRVAETPPPADTSRRATIKSADRTPTRKRTPQGATPSDKSSEPSSGPPSAADRATSVGGGAGGADPAAPARRSEPSGRGASTGAKKRSETTIPPAATSQPAANPVSQTTTTLGDTVGHTTETLRETTTRTTETLDNVVTAVTGPGPLADTVNRTTDVVDDAVAGLTGTVDNTVGGVGGLLNGLTGSGG